MFAIAVFLGWNCYQLDVKTAFLHRDLEEEVYGQGKASQ